MGKAGKVVLVLLAVVVGAIVMVLPKSGENEAIILCGGSMRAVLKDCIERYNATSDAKVLGSYGGSGDLCMQLQNTGRGDLYLCHDPFMPWAAKKGLITEWETVGYLDVVMIVPKGNPKNIKEVKDLGQDGLRLGIGNKTRSSSGVLVKEMFKRMREGTNIFKNVRVETKGHQQRCTDVTLGTLDASIVWAPVASLYTSKLEIISVPEEQIHDVTSATYGHGDLKNVAVTVGVTKAGANNDVARDFYKFITTQCTDLFEKHKFRLKKR